MEEEAKEEEEDEEGDRGGNDDSKDIVRVRRPSVSPPSPSLTPAPFLILSCVPNHLPQFSSLFFVLNPDSTLQPPPPHLTPPVKSLPTPVTAASHLLYNLLGILALFLLFFNCPHNWIDR